MFTGVKEPGLSTVYGQFPDVVVLLGEMEDCEEMGELLDGVVVPELDAEDGDEESP